MIRLRAIDVSAYQKDIPWDELLKNGVCDIAIIKGAQGQYTRDHVNQARARGIKYIILYFWHDPTLAIFYQILVASNDIKEFNPIAVFLDCEQWWGNWDQYWEFLAGKRALKDMIVVSPQGIADNAYGVLNGLKTAFPALLIGTYTATWFTNGWAAPMLKWLMNFVLWVASYFDYGNATYKVTYDQIKAAPPDIFVPSIPAGVKGYVLLQYSSRQIYPGQTYPWDSNVGSGTLNDFLILAGIGENTMAATYNTLVSQKDRAKILMLTSDTDKASFDGIDLIMPCIGGMDASGPKRFRDISLDKWLNQADIDKVPASPYYLLDAAYWLNGSGTDKGVVDNMPQATNPILIDILNSLHAGGWTFATLDATVGWKKFHGVNLMIYNNLTANGGSISNQWQVSTLNNVLRELIALKNAKKFPDVPLLIWSNPTWLQLYATTDPLYTYFKNKKDVTFMGISQFLSFNAGPQLADMQTVFANRPPDTFKFAFTPEAYDSSGTNSHVMFHGFTADYFKIPQVVNASGVPQPLELGLGCDVKQVMYDFFKFKPGTVTPPPSGRTPEQVDAALAVVEAKLKAIKDLL